MSRAFALSFHLFIPLARLLIRLLYLTIKSTTKFTTSRFQSRFQSWLPPTKKQRPNHRVGLQHSHCACLERTTDTPRCPQGTVAAPLTPWWCAVVHRRCRQALKQHNTLTLGTLTKRYTKRDKLNPYVYEQLCDYARYFCRYTSCD